MGNQAVTGIKMEAAAPAVVKTADEWKAVLSPDTFRVARMHGTEPAWSGKFNMTKDPGAYHCACCGNLLFHSTQKFDSRSGWPSYTSVSACAVTDSRGTVNHFCAAARHQRVYSTSG
jgi:peptide methionine sulfoxide reductase MsrB